MTAVAPHLSRRRKITGPWAAVVAMVGIAGSLLFIPDVRFHAHDASPDTISMAGLAGVTTLAEREDVFLGALTTLCNQQGCDPKGLSETIRTSSAQMTSQDLTAALEDQIQTLAKTRVAIDAAIRADDGAKLAILRAEAEAALQIAAHYRSRLRARPPGL